MSRCEAQVRLPGLSFGHYARCSNNAQEGKRFCKVHDPEYIKIKQQLRSMAWDAQDKRKAELQQLFPEGCGAWVTEDTLYRGSKNLTVVFRLSDERIRELAKIIQGWHDHVLPW